MALIMAFEVEGYGVMWAVMRNKHNFIWPKETMKEYHFSLS